MSFVLGILHTVGVNLQPKCFVKRERKCLDHDKWREIKYDYDFQESLLAYANELHGGSFESTCMMLMGDCKNLHVYKKRMYPFPCENQKMNKAAIKRGCMGIIISFESFNSNINVT